MTSYMAPRSPAFAAAGSEYMPSSSSTTGVAPASVSGPPTLVAPREDQAIPAYLLHSSHHTLFQVGGSPLATSYSAPTVHNQPYLDRLQERISSGGALVRRERIPLPSRLDVKQCCKRLLVTGDTKVQFVPERDEQGRESKSVPGGAAAGAPSSRRRRIPQNDESEDDEYPAALAFSSKLNRNDPDKDAASVRADQPIPPQAGVYYFEVTVISRGQKGYIGVGFSTRNVDLERLPGWNTESYGYHGDDGKAFASSGTGQAYGPRFTSGDVIGCGIDFVARRAFFVKNGQWLGYVFDLTSALRDPATAGGAGQDPDLPPVQPGSRRERERERERKAKEAQGRLRFYPTIGLQTVGETVKVNFGQDKFVFDIESFVKRRQQETTEEVLSFRIPLEYKHMLSTRRSQPIASGSSGPPMLPSAQPSLLPPAASLAPEDKSTFPDDASDTHLRTALENLISGYLNHQGFTATSRAFRKQRAEEKSDWADLLVPSESVPDGGSASALTSTSTPSTTATKEKKGKTGSKSASTKKKASSSFASASAAPGTDSGDDGSGAVRMMKSAIRTTLGSGERSEVDQVYEEGAAAGPSSMVSSADASGSGTPVATSRRPEQPLERRRLDSRADHDMADVRDDLMLSDLPADAAAVPREKGSEQTRAGLAEEHEEAELLDTALRQRICACIRSGDIDGALKRLEEGFAEVLHPSRNTNSLSGTMRSAGKSFAPGCASGSGISMAAGGGADLDMDILFRLRCRKFVELALRSCDGESSADGVVDDLMNIDDEDEEVASALISSRHSTPGSGLLPERCRGTAGNTIKTKGKGKERVDECNADGTVAAHDDNAEEIDRDEMMDDDDEEGTEVEDVLTYGATLSALYPRTLSTPQTREYLDIIFSLVAYGDPRSAPRAEIRALCEQARRDELADAVNRAMLECKGRPGIPDLERVLRQAIATKEVLGEVFGEPRAALVGDVLGL